MELRLGLGIGLRLRLRLGLVLEVGSPLQLEALQPLDVRLAAE